MVCSIKHQVHEANLLLRLSEDKAESFHNNIYSFDSMAPFKHGFRFSHLF